MSNSNKLLNEVEQEISKNKAPSWVRLMLMLVKSVMKELKELRDFVNSPDSDDLNRRV
ncbi:hypothetical protein K7V76_000682 [Vibrio fluvialis]|nr:hypothetical protein [Vibrio fluvialis]EKO3527251.1 hypothetical protein [Vibrio fluvialis]